MTKTVLAFALILLSVTSWAQGYKVGDTANDFKLKNIDNKFVALSDYTSAKGVVVIFTCNHCPYSVAYEDRIIELDKKYKDKGFPVVAINPNDPVQYPDDSFENMQKRATDKGFTFPYLFDADQSIYPVYGATKTPHVYLLKKAGKNFEVAYIGAIDNNSQDATEVTEPYLANAIESLLAGKPIAVTETKAIGCGIKAKKK